MHLYQGTCNHMRTLAQPLTATSFRLMPIYSMEVLVTTTGSVPQFESTSFPSELEGYESPERFNEVLSYINTAVRDIKRPLELPSVLGQDRFSLLHQLIKLCSCGYVYPQSLQNYLYEIVGKIDDHLLSINRSAVSKSSFWTIETHTRKFDCGGSEERTDYYVVLEVNTGEDAKKLFDCFDEA